MSESLNQNAEVVRLPDRRRGQQQAQFPTLLEKLQGYQSLIRIWRLKGAPLTVAAHVLDSLWGWGKMQDEFTNAEIAAATGLADSTVRLALKRLYGLGCLKKVSYNGHRTIIAVDVDWRPDAGDETAPNSADLNAEDQRTDRRFPASAEPLLDSETIGKRETQYSAQRSEPGEGKAQDPQPAKLRSRQPMWRPSRTPDTMPLPVPALHSAWKEEWAKTFHDRPCPTWGPREFGIAKNLVERLAKDYHRAPDVQEKIREVVRRWRWIGAQQFPWMKDKPPPAYPDIGFVQKYWAAMEIALGQWRKERMATDGDGYPLHPEEVFKPLPFTRYEDHPVTKMEERNILLAAGRLPR